MANNVTKRIDILPKLSPWDDVHHATDEHFVMAYPYEQDESSDVQILVSDYADQIRYEIMPPKRTSRKSVYGVRVWVGDVYLGQKLCFIVNLKNPLEIQRQT